MNSAEPAVRHDGDDIARSYLGFQTLDNFIDFRNGGGGFTMYKDAPVVYRSSEEVRELIIDWVEKHKTVPTQSTNNWRIVGVQ